jgi:hypothetical protein
VVFIQLFWLCTFLVFHRAGDHHPGPDTRKAGSANSREYSGDRRRVKVAMVEKSFYR